MDALHPDFRKQLEDTVTKARKIAEAGARAALGRLAVADAEAFQNLSDEERKLRGALRAKARQLSGYPEPTKKLRDIDRLSREVAYEHWHRMLFARFLAENHLLLHPDHENLAVSIEDCKGMAEEESKATGTPVNAWQVASRLASRMLPQIFRQDDPALALVFSPEHVTDLERLVEGLPAAVFTAEDSLGWVYQYWQKEEKKRVNDSGQKINGDTLPAVTQLFTEHYMVLYLLHNSVGAWHAGKVLAAQPGLANTAATEEELRKAVALTVAGGYTFDYLRFVRTADGSSTPWRPAAGTFSGWPKVAARLRILDPCCGSGHFLVAVFLLLVRLRMAEELLGTADAIDAVMRDNLFGLEIDARCTQIAAFNVALTAWRLNMGWRRLPRLNIACTGIEPNTPAEQWLKLVEPRIANLALRDRGPIRLGVTALHSAFTNARTLGSLIDVGRVQSVGAADWETVKPYLEDAIRAEVDDELHADAVGAAGIADAARILAGPDGGFTLVITNVPYLGRGKQDDRLQAWADEFEQDAKADIATMFISRGMSWLCNRGSIAFVGPQNWLFLTAYKHLRARFLKDNAWNTVVRLGTGAFETITGHVVNVALVTLTRGEPSGSHIMLGVDASAAKSPVEKAGALRGELLMADLRLIPQSGQLKNPNSAIRIADSEPMALLGAVGRAWQGMVTGDDNRFVAAFWERQQLFGWKRMLQAPQVTSFYTGRSDVVRWSDDEYDVRRSRTAHNFPPAALMGRRGIAVQRVSKLAVTLFDGDPFDDSVSPFIPVIEGDLPALWAFLESPQFAEDVRSIDTGLKVVPGSINNTAFDLGHWQQVASERYPNGLPEPESDDPTQWVFHGRPEASEQPLLVAAARLVGYRWPTELDGGMRLSSRARALVKRCEELLGFADADGVVAIPPASGESPAAERLRDLLEAVYGSDWSAHKLQGLLLHESSELGRKKPFSSLEEYLRDGFFERHCSVFHNRPFVWHIWDEEPDGFSVLVNCHKLCDGKQGRQLLEKLIHVYLGDWIARREKDKAAGASGGERLAKAAIALRSKLLKILEGEPPFDIFVRWKKLSEQASGWCPDVNDGVRMNVRPFVEAGILRKKVGSLNWKKDRGNEPRREPAWQWPWFYKVIDGKETFTGERVNDVHLTLEQKRQARQREAAECPPEKAASPASAVPAPGDFGLLLSPGSSGVEASVADNAPTLALARSTGGGNKSSTGRGKKSRGGQQG